MSALGRVRKAASASTFELDISLPGLPRDEAEELIHKADQACPYSNALRGNVPVRLKLV